MAASADLNVVDVPRPARRGFEWLRVAAVDQLCDDAVAISFELPPRLAESYAHQAGQSLTIRRATDDVDERRSYSICAAVGSPPRIGVREVADGALSSWLARDLRAGDLVEVSRPTGHFTPDLGVAARHVLICAGSGVTPMLSIASSVLAADDASTIVLIYGNRRAENVMFTEEIADLKNVHPARVELMHVLSREAQDVELFSGRIDVDRLTSMLPVIGGSGAVDHWWLCGPHAMVISLNEQLLRLGVRSDQIHRELFWVEDSPPLEASHVDASVAASSTVKLRLDGRETTVAATAGQSILEAAARSRPDLPFACRGGVCGTCRALVVDGQVRLRRNFALGDDELARGYTLTCQAVPTTESVTVDYDT